MSINKQKIKFISCAFLIIAASCLLPYLNSLHNPFIWDDEALILKNPLIKNCHLWYRAFTNELYPQAASGSNFYRPIQTLSYIWDYYLWHLDPFGYHITNVILQILVAGLVLLFVYSISKEILISFASALLFALNPLATEAVTYISGRAEPLLGLFLLSSFLAFKKSQSGKFRIAYLFLSLFLFVVGLLSKELAVVFPLVILAYVFYTPRPKTAPPLAGRMNCGRLSIPPLKVPRAKASGGLHFARDNLKERGFFAKRILAFFIIVGVYLALRLSLLNFPTLRPPKLVEFPLILRITVLPKVILTYLKLLLLPVNLHMSWELTVRMSFMGIFILWFLLGIIFVACAYILIYKRDKGLAPFMLSWSLIFFLPQSGILPINAFIAEHFIYLSSISFFTLVSYLLHRYLRKELFVLSIIGLGLYYGILTAARNSEWQNPRLFYEQLIQVSPESFQAQNNLGLQYEYAHLYEKAVSQYRRALEIEPGLLEARSNLANLYFKMGRFQEAKREYVAVAKTAPQAKAGEIQNNIGCIYEIEGRIDEALNKYKLAIRLDPSLNFSHFNIARIYFSRGNMGSASEEILKSLPTIRLTDKKPQPYLEIIEEYLNSLKDANYPAAFYNNLGALFASAHLLDAAVPCFERVLELEPLYADAHFNLGLSYWKMSLRRRAIFEFKTALKIDPKHSKARRFLSEVVYRK